MAAAPASSRTRLTHAAVGALLLLAAAFPARAAETIGNDPAPVDVIVQQGEDFRARLVMKAYSSINDTTGRVMDLTGYGYRAQAAAAASAAPFVNFSANIVDPAAGTVDLSLSKAQTLRNGNKSGFWDLLQIDPSGAVRYLMKGLVKFLPTVARP